MRLYYTHTHTCCNNTEHAASFTSSSQVRHQSGEVKSTREVTGRRFNLILHTARVTTLFFARHQHAFQPLINLKQGVKLLSTKWPLFAEVHVFFVNNCVLADTVYSAE